MTALVSMSFAASLSHKPAAPERTVYRSMGDDVTFKTFPTVEAMHKELTRQGWRASSPVDWKPLSARYRKEVQS